MADKHDETEAEPGVEAPEALVNWLAGQLDESLSSVAGYAVRVDAGEDGQVWIALEGGVDDPDAEDGLLQALEHRIESLRDDAPGQFDLEVSTGRMGDELLLRCRVLEPTSGPE